MYFLLHGHGVTLSAFFSKIGSVRDDQLRRVNQAFVDVQKELAHFSKGLCLDPRPTQLVRRHPCSPLQSRPLTVIVSPWLLLHVGVRCVWLSRFQTLKHLVQPTAQCVNFLKKLQKLNYAQTFQFITCC